MTSPSIRRRVAIVISDMDRAGGIQRVVANLANDFADHCDVTVVVGSASKASAFAFDPRVAMVALDLPRRRRGLPGHLRWLWRSSRALTTVLKDARIEVALGIWTDYACALAISTSGARIIACEHIYAKDTFGIWDRTRKLLYRRCAAVVSLTEADTGAYRVLNPAVSVIPNSFGASLPPQADPSRRVILAVGHFVRRKGYDRLIWAMSRLRDDFPDWRLRIVGGGPLGHVDEYYFNYCANLIHVLRLEDRVEIAPTTRNIAAHYLDASILALASEVEGLPMVLIEAKSYGLATVSFDCPTGPGEIIRHEVDGLLVPPGDLDALTAALRRLAASPALRAEYGEAARQDAQDRFSPDVVRGRWFHLFDSLTKTPAESQRRPQPAPVGSG